MISTIINYAVWYVMVFFTSVWLVAFVRNRDEISGNPEPPDELPSVSVIVPAYNEEDVIEDTVQSLLNLDYPDDKLEVMVVDDGSEDATLRKAKKFEPEVKVISKEKNRGKAHSLNIGVDRAKGEIVACLDADSFVEKDTLKKMVGYFKEDEVGCVTPALKADNRTNSLSKAQYVEYLMNVFMRKVMSFLDIVPVAPGPFSLYRKEVVEKLGGFDEDNITEDMEIALKIHDGGYRIESTTDAEVRTICPERLGELYRQRLRWYRGVIYNSLKYRHLFFNRKYGNLGIFFLPVNLVAVFLIMILFGIMGYNIFKGVYTLFNNLYMIGFDVGPFVSEMKIVPDVSIFMINFSTILFSTITLVGVAMIYLSFKKTDEELIQNKLGFFTFLLFYPLLLMAFWSISIVYELLNVKKKW